MQKKSFAAAVKAAFPHTIPIMTGYMAVGLGRLRYFMICTIA